MDSLDSRLSERGYLSQRREPGPGDHMYLHLSDLALAVRAAVADLSPPADVLDFGCGGSPYRHLFEHANYRRADFASPPDDARGLDYHIGVDGRIDAPPESFDLVLSTQVLEHVEDVQGYLRQCADLLRPGGRLLLTTHGTFEDHDCPHDFRRWTAYGLRHDIGKAGFEVTATRKLTTDARAVAFLLRLKSAWMWSNRGFGVLFWLVHSLLTRHARAFDVWCDKRFARYRVVDSEDPDHSLYIALLVVARKR
jgi:SAM-dependent methyltransferase